MPTDAYRYVLTVDGREIELTDGEVTIGRSRTSTVRIDHESVSRSHALLTLDKGQAVVKDLNSSNGTYVGGRRVINETKLSDGDRIQLGAAVIAYRVVWSTKSERTALIDAEMANAAPPPPADSAPAEASPAAPLSSDTGNAAAAEAKAPEPSSSPAPAEPPIPPPLEISAPDLARAQRAAPPPVPVAAVAAAAALEAVRSVGEPPPPPEPPRPLIRIPAPAKVAPPQPPPPPAPNLASVPLRSASRAAHVPPPVPALAGNEVPATFWARFLAQLVDGVVLTAVNIVLLSPVFLILFFRGELQPRESGPDAALLVVTILCGLLMIAANVWYVVGGWAKSGRTPGKSLLNIAVVVPGRPAGSGIGWKPAFLRALGTVLSSLLLGIGYLVALVRRDRRALHDMVAGTRVVKLPPA